MKNTILTICIVISVIGLLLQGFLVIKLLGYHVRWMALGLSVIQIVQTLGMIIVFSFVKEKLEEEHARRYR